MAVRKRAATTLAAMLSLSELCFAGAGLAEPLGLPPLTIPQDNPQTADKIALGNRLFHDLRFSSDGSVACATCHKDDHAFTDSPLRTSEGVGKKTGTRNAPTVINAAYFTSFFWDGRSPTLEDQSQHPFLNPVEMGLPTHEPILLIARSDPFYVELFKKAFGKTGDGVTMEEVKKAIAAYERTIISGESPFDRWRFGNEETAISEAAKRGFEVFVGQGRCVSCHVIEQNQALFTDNRFHNIGVGINRAQFDVPRLSAEFLNAKSKGVDVDKAVLTDPKTSELGRFAVTDQFDVIGAFKTPTLRNVAVTAPYMHDGSLKTLKDVVKHYNNGGRSEGDPAQVNDYLSGGIRPLNLSEQQMDDLVAFMETLTTPAYFGAKTR
ncbi:cytochrome c551 peroxidase [Methylosinus sp. C49]|jgi:cytochrome c peroxidase|uniref:cytochrome-c peroxidase n=1 Tax=Methylosinus sp. C49 TaxID=2699395 RepID=UPI0013669CF6|nr:cytochrome c peroxidase [Methylosinus sp. C49]BBU62292.1 cytochrome c551 peroxidase [Methylosinus sp. C49]